MSIDPTFTVGGIPFGDVDSAGVQWSMGSESGWYSGPGVRGDLTDRLFGHGQFDAQRYRTARQVSIGGVCAAPNRAAALDASRRLTGILGDGGAGTLTVVDQAGSLSASVRLEDQPQVGWITDAMFQWALLLIAADPRKYAAAISDVCGTIASGGGLVFPLFSVGGVLTFGTIPAPAVADLTNPGTATTPVLLTVAAGGSAWAGGFQIVESQTGNVLRYTDDLPAGSTVTFDSATGLVTLNGTADRRSSLSIAQWTQAPGGAYRAFTIAGLLSNSATAQLTAAIRPAYW